MTATSSTGSKTPSSEPRASSRPGTLPARPLRWIEIAVPAHAEAVEAVSEILTRVGYNGIAIEEPLEPSPHAEHLVKAYLIHDSAARGRVRAVREALGHLQAFGLGPIGTLRLRRVEDEDWLESWKASFTPLRIGRFLVRPTWSDADPGDAIVLELDPGMAFGTGLHPTTQQCLRALSVLDIMGKTVADIGTGSAILAIAAAKRGAASVVAVDIDPVSMRAATENVARNRVAVTVGRGSAAEVPGRHDLVLANIVAPVLQQIAPDLARCTAAGGLLVTAGIIAAAEDETVAAFEAAGFRSAGREQDGDWVSWRFGR
ncbi:MAG TPA: 50S ribosomal protein L11 methyltransferase [Candidatus Saccharimonadales bacterium]|nr:50S ribosomal protein L11 methyltransferase [Candidatus Saccharimonadales bacterium]